jgi:hypothetical protein
VIPIHSKIYIFCFSQKFYDEKNKKLDSGPANLKRHEDVKTTSTRRLLPSGNVTGNDNGIPVIPSILNRVPSASGIPNIVAAGRDIPDIVCGPMPENNESAFSVRSGFSEDSRSESERSDSEYSESAMTEMSSQASKWDRELGSASIAVIQEFTSLKHGN